jgi:hypothetical protein
MFKFLEKVYDGLISNPFNTIGALIIFLLALPMIRAGLKDKPPPLPQPPISPVEIESPWLIQNLTRMQLDIEGIQGQLGIMSNKIDGIAKLLKRRQRQQPKP